jgi:hypothetical protein
MVSARQSGDSPDMKNKTLLATDPSGLTEIATTNKSAAPLKKAMPAPQLHLDFGITLSLITAVN